MGKSGRDTRFEEEVFRMLGGRKEVTQTCWGSVGHFRGGALLKAANGTPGQITVQVCQPGRLRKIHVYTKDCPETLRAIQQFAAHRGVAHQQR